MWWCYVIFFQLILFKSEMITWKYSLESNRKNKHLLTNLGETHSFLSVRLGFAEPVATSIKYKQKAERAFIT